MANNIIHQPGDTIGWTNSTGSAVFSGDVVVLGSGSEARLGIALVDIADTETGSVRIKNTIGRMPKVAGAVIAAGETVIYDASASAFDDNQATPATGDVSGAASAVADAASGDATVDVLFMYEKGTLT